MEVKVFASLEKVLHAASALSGVVAVCAVEYDTHFQRHTSGNRTATAHDNTPAALLSLLLAANCCSVAVM